MESIKELRVKLQTNVLGHPILQRVLSIYLTRLFLITNVTANQVSAAVLVVGALSAAAIFLGYIWLGFFLVYFSILLDAVDGEIARYRKTYSLRGVYLDLVNHLITHGLFFLALTFWVVEGLSDPLRQIVLILGVLGAFSMSLRRANGDLHRVLFVHQYSTHPELFTIPHVQSETKTATPIEPKTLTWIHSSVRLIRKAVYASEYLAVMVIILFLTFVSEIVFFPAVHNHPLLSVLIIAYAIVSFSYLLREVINGYFSVEGRVAKVRDRFASK
ncbi:MAG: CDP-alcohol phosphatidyltransferase family protein [Candidatus Paceibacterota bacterium]|jgi:phosphatidylglycerophosphate synthase